MTSLRGTGERASLASN